MINFVVNSSTLRSLLKSVSRNLVSKPLLPIMGKLKVTSCRGQLSVTATDDESWSRYVMLQQGTDIFDGEGSFCIDPVLMSLLRELPEQPVQVLADDDRMATVKYQGGQACLPVFPADDFPPMPPVEGADYVIEASWLLRTLQQCLFAVSVGDVLRPVLSGVCLDFADGGPTVSASNGFLLYRRRSVASGPEGRLLILPHKTALLLADMLDRSVRLHAGKEDRPCVSLVCSEQNALFTIDGNCICSKLIRGKYPNYNNVIPASQSYRCYVQREAFVGVLRRVTSSLSEVVTLVFSTSSVTVETASEFTPSTCRETMPCEWNGPDRFGISFKGNFLLDILGHLYTDVVSMSLDDPKRACVFRGMDDADDALFLLMPVSN